MSDSNALVKVVRLHSVQVRTFIARYVRGPGLVDELATEVFRLWQMEGHDGLGVAERLLSLASVITQERLGQLAGEARRAGRQTERLVHQWQRARLAHDTSTGKGRLAEKHDECLKLLASVRDQLPAEDLELWRAYYLRRRTLQQLSGEARSESRDSRHFAERLNAMRSRVVGRLSAPASRAKKSSQLGGHESLSLWAQFVADELPLEDDGRLADSLTRGEQTVAALADIECDQLLRASAESEGTIESFVDRVLLSCSTPATASPTPRGELPQRFAARKTAGRTRAIEGSKEGHGRRALLSVGALGATACLMVALLSQTGARSSSQAQRVTRPNAVESLPQAQTAVEANPTTMPIWRSSRDES
ncbi:MAG: hypothetical protein KDB14_16130, partial [Planctomycetales bacterium]|nr:hypothetical protein [Planctomycetales bacterium]